ncbi:TIGR04376 family protein [Dactylococcopsis salina]|uniref:TIGR04376 family protein n=1 Tax=Dactylococcopsis salina (strain PCC 8305) TaxID=13035 RepID=K9YVZ1_DACS8|nr:TIGR04376 family protein [Dactylococcopsis salina]AFZ51101.1 hypothetical protein Dacsa_2510 [Dactylococcopsis salina PCC 8305]
MSLLDDLTQFLETRLDEFLRNNPHLELQALEEQLREQEKDTIRLILDLKKQEKTVENEILSIAQDIKLWHQRVEKAKAANRQDLLEAAQEKEASLLRLGNQKWGKMKGIKEQIRQGEELVEKVRQRQKEVKAKAQQVKSKQGVKSDYNSTWNPETVYGSKVNSAYDELEEKFRNWEVEQELNAMKQRK